MILDKFLEFYPIEVIEQITSKKYWKLDILDYQ